MLSYYRVREQIFRKEFLKIFPIVSTTNLLEILFTSYSLTIL